MPSIWLSCREILYSHLSSRKMDLGTCCWEQLRIWDDVTSLILALQVQGSSVWNRWDREVEKPLGMSVATTQAVTGRMLIGNKCQPSASSIPEEKGLVDLGVWAWVCWSSVFWGTVGQWSAVVPQGVECKPVVNDRSVEAQVGKKVFGLLLKCTLAAK